MAEGNSGWGKFFLGLAVGAGVFYVGSKYIERREREKRFMRLMLNPDSGQSTGLERKVFDPFNDSSINLKEAMSMQLPQDSRFQEYLRKRDVLVESIDTNLEGDESHFEAEDVCKRIEELDKEYPEQAEIYDEKLGFGVAFRDIDIIAKKAGYSGMNDPEFNEGMEELQRKRESEPEILADKYGLCKGSSLEEAISKIDSSADTGERGHAMSQYMDEIKKLIDVHPAEYTRLNRILSRHSTVAYKKYNPS